MSVVLSVSYMLVDLFVVTVQVTVSVAFMQFKVSAAFMQVKGSAANMWVTIFIEIMHVGVSCNHAGGIFYSVIMEVTFCCSYVCDSVK